MKKNNKKGFTLAELLIVVAIIAVLVAIAIPVFSAQLEKSREATDLANIRSAYAEVIVQAIEGGYTTAPSKTVALKQQTNGWTNTDASADPAAICGSATYVSNTPSKGGSATVTWVDATTTVEGHCTISFSGAAAAGD